MLSAIPAARRIATTGFVFGCAMAFAVLVAGPAQAARLFSGHRVVVEEPDTIHDDVYASGGNVTVRGVIDGDVVAAGGEVVVEGTVLGSVLACGGNVRVDGDVVRSVRAAGGEVNIGAHAGHDLVVGAGQLTVLPEARVGRDMLAGGGRTTIEGQIARNAKIGTGRLRLGQQAVIGGDLEYASDRDMVRMPGSTVNGKTTWYAANWERKHRSPVEMWFARMFAIGRFTMGVLILGLLFVLLFPTAAQRSLEHLATQPLPSTGVGLLTVVLLPLAAMALFFLGLVVGGWWVGAMVLAAWGLAMGLGCVVAATTIGRWLGAKLGTRGLALGWSLLIGALVLMVIRLIPLLGTLLAFLIMLAGLGALAMTVGAAISAGRPKRAVAPMAPAPAPAPGPAQM